MSDKDTKNEASYSEIWQHNSENIHTWTPTFTRQLRLFSVQQLGLARQSEVMMKKDR